MHLCKMYSRHCFLMCFTGYTSLDTVRWLSLPLTVSAALAQLTSDRSACWSPTSLVGHSAERRDMLVPRTRTQFGRWIFQVAAPVIWNSLPARLRPASVSRSRRQFRDGLKTNLVLQAYT